MSSPTPHTPFEVAFGGEWIGCRVGLPIEPGDTSNGGDAKRKLYIDERFEP